MSVELLFMPSVYAPCPTCHGARYNEKTLAVTYRGKNIAEVLAFSVDEAYEFFADTTAVRHALKLVRDIGLGYLRLGTVRDRVVRRRGSAHQARHGTSTHPARRNPVRHRRAHHRTASRGRRQTHDPVGCPGPGRQYGDRRRTRNARRGGRRLDHRHGDRAPATWAAKSWPAARRTRSRPLNKARLPHILPQRLRTCAPATHDVSACRCTDPPVNGILSAQNRTMTRAPTIELDGRRRERAGVRARRARRSHAPGSRTKILPAARCR